MYASIQIDIDLEEVFGGAATDFRAATMAELLFRRSCSCCSSPSSCMMPCKTRHACPCLACLKWVGDYSRCLRTDWNVSGHPAIVTLPYRPPKGHPRPGDQSLDVSLRAQQWPREVLDVQQSFNLWSKHRASPTQGCGLLQGSSNLPLSTQSDVSKTTVGI